MRKLAYAVLSPKLEILPIILCKIDDSRNFAARFKFVFFTAFFAVAGEIPESHIKKNTFKIINVTGIQGILPDRTVKEKYRPGRLCACQQDFV